MEEMSTREIIETIIKGRTTILGLTAICIVIGLIVNLFILEPVYEAETTLMISPISQTNANAKAINEFSSLVNAIAAYPEMSIGTYREQIKAPAILQYIKEEMNLKDLSLKSISDKITVEAIKNTNLITVKVRDKNAEVAAQIANILSERYTRGSSRIRIKSRLRVLQRLLRLRCKRKKKIWKMHRKKSRILYPSPVARRSLSWS